GGTVITDKTCQGKALFVIPGNDVTVRNLTLTRARVPDNNGAGIRAEGRNLTADRVRFINNQDGILAGGPPQSTLQIEHCTFAANGEPDPQLPTATLFVGELDHLSIHDTEFQPGRGGAVISSDTKVTEIVNSHIARPGSPRGTPVQVSGGLVAEDSTFQAGPAPGGKQAAILVVSGSLPDPVLILKRNRLEGSGTLLLNWSGHAPVLQDNVVGPGGQISSTSGEWEHRVRAFGREAYSTLRHWAGSVRNRLRERFRH
ncbi:MAG: hypothetical protein JOY71_13735, partial [Acetobacteraceae bacterium]|nr:hypothetical protein [Acetobacteraceae bacterium]